MPSTARERRREHLRADVVGGTLALIERSGADAATIDAITDEVGVARATIYAHFPEGRESILRAVYEAAGVDLVDRARRRAGSLNTWQERIIAYAAEMIEFSSSPTLGRFYSVTGPALVGFRQGGGAGTRGYRADISAELTQAQAAGELPAHADAEALAVLLASSLRDAGIAAAEDPLLAERFVDAVRLLLAGLRSGSASGQVAP